MGAGGGFTALPGVARLGARRGLLEVKLTLCNELARDDDDGS